MAFLILVRKLGDCCSFLILAFSSDSDRGISSSRSPPAGEKEKVRYMANTKKRQKV